MQIDASLMQHEELNDLLRQNKASPCEIINCLGQRFIAAGSEDNDIIIRGTPGNALAAYLNGAKIEVFGNAQDAVGDTMNAGKVIIRGNVGDAVGYAMRGGEIFVEGNAGYRAGIHMKEYQNKIPKLVIGGSAGSFLGEYQAGGLIVVLGLDSKGPIVSNFPCTGMHGGKMLLRSDCKDIKLPPNVTKKPIKIQESEFLPIIEEYCNLFGKDLKKVLGSPFTLITPDGNNPYKQMYVQN